MKFTIQVEFVDGHILEVYPTSTMLEWFQRNQKTIDKIVIEGVTYILKP